MSKRIVFLYRTQKNREDLILYESIIRALLRKFRKSALFSYLQIDTSPSCRSSMCDLIHIETSRRGAIFLESDAQSISLCMDLMEDAFELFTSSHHISGRTICYPGEITETKRSETSISYTRTYKAEHIRKAAKLSLEKAKSGKHSISVCLTLSGEPSLSFLREAEIVLDKEKHIKTQIISLDEMISLCIRTVPSFDVVLTLAEYAPLIAMHLNSMPDIPAGYVVSHGEKHNVYHRQILAHEEIGNLHHFSSLLGVAAIFENEFGMKNAANWLRRALTLSFEKEANSTCEDFIKSVINEIETPIRKRRTE